jgi:primosomal protein N' (replication factor Y) (superfamily II helicase)
VSLRKVIATVALFAPLRQMYDYIVSSSMYESLLIGHRVWVPLRSSFRVGIVLRIRDSSAVDISRFKLIIEILDESPIVSEKMLDLACWASAYYHHPIGEVVATILPAPLRKKALIPSIGSESWVLTELGRQAIKLGSVKGSRQKDLLTTLERNESVSAEELGELDYNWRSPMRIILERNYAVKRLVVATPMASVGLLGSKTVLNAEQTHASKTIHETLGRFQPTVLYGVTGSGKTEVYFDVIDTVIERGGQILFLLPEIALTKHLVKRFRHRFGNQVAALHSGLNNKERLTTWVRIQKSEVRVLLGTRSAVWLDLPDLKLIIVDEEHDTAYKQQDGFRYSARDIAIVRAQRANIPVVLGSATPSFETLVNVEHRSYQLVRLNTRPLASSKTKVQSIDVRGLKLIGGLSEPLIRNMRDHLGNGRQVVLFLNRRGFSPMMICRSCGMLMTCLRCDAYLVYHKQKESMICHHCGYRKSAFSKVNCCIEEVIEPLGLGTEGIEEAVRDLFPDKRVCRVDRDSIRSPKALEKILSEIGSGEIDILIGTQMVSKGLDFENVTLVGVVDADSRLYSIDFRAEERLAQLLVQVSGRAGRGSKPGAVFIQTHKPENAVLRRIIDDGYDAYSKLALPERKEVGFPPYVAMALVRAESKDSNRPTLFLAKVREILVEENPKADISFPIPAVMALRAGRVRALLIVRAPVKIEVQSLLAACLDKIENLSKVVRIRWTIDVDPQETL